MVPPPEGPGADATHGGPMKRPAPDLEAFLAWEQQLGPVELAPLAAAARAQKFSADERTEAMFQAVSALNAASRTQTWLDIVVRTARSGRERPHPVDVRSMVDAALAEAAIADAAIAVAAWELVGTVGFTARHRDALVWSWIEAFGSMTAPRVARAA